MDGSKVGFTLRAPIDAFASKVSTIAHAHLEKVLREVLRVRCVKFKVQVAMGWPKVAIRGAYIFVLRLWSCEGER